MPGVPKTMRAAAIDRFGGPEELKIHTLPVPEIGPKELLIAVHTAGAASWDAEMRAGWSPEGKPEFPLVLGTVGAEDERKLGLSFRRPACAHLRVPTRRASGVHGDEQLLGSDLRNGEGVDLELLGATKAIDGGCSHGLRNAWHRSDLRVVAKMLRELAKSMRLKELASARCALRPTIQGTFALLLEHQS